MVWANILTSQLQFLMFWPYFIPLALIPGYWHYGNWTVIVVLMNRPSFFAFRFLQPLRFNSMGPVKFAQPPQRQNKVSV